MLIMSVLWSIAEAVSSGSWPILFHVLKLNVTIWLVLLCFDYFCFNLISASDLSNTEARAPTSAGRTPFLPVRRAMAFGHVVWVWIIVIFWWLGFILIRRSHSKRGSAVVPWLKSLILAFVPWDLSAQYLVRHAVDPSFRSSICASTTLLPMAFDIYLEKSLPPPCLY